MAAADRANLANAKVVYALDAAAKPRHGAAKLDAATGQLTYAPDPGFIGEDRFNYYTVDENNPRLGVENVVVVTVEPIRDLKHMNADRSRAGRSISCLSSIIHPRWLRTRNALPPISALLGALFHERQLDYRIGVLTTDFVNGGGRKFKKVRAVELDAAGNPVLDRKQRPKQITKQVASNGTLVMLPVLPQPWVTPSTPDGIFAELVKVGTNGDSNRTAFTAVYNFVAGYANQQHAARARTPLRSWSFSWMRRMHGDLEDRSGRLTHGRMDRDRSS